MASERLARLTFGKNAKEHISKQIKAYISAKFGGSLTLAAASLEISKQRLQSYTSARSFPRAEVIDLIGEKWGPDVVGMGERTARLKKREGTPLVQLGLFDEPVTLTNDQMTVIIERKGANLAVRIEIAARAKIA
jgi:hypothetical protein